MTTENKTTENTITNSENYITEEPYYLATGDEIEVFNSALAENIPMQPKNGAGSTCFPVAGSPLTREVVTYVAIISMKTGCKKPSRRQRIKLG